MSNVKKGKFVYKNEDSMKKMHEFYDKTLVFFEWGIIISWKK